MRFYGSKQTRTIPNPDYPLFPTSEPPGAADTPPRWRVGTVGSLLVAADLVGVSEDLARAWVNDGKFAVVKRSTSRKPLIAMNAAWRLAVEGGAR
jgi:hypothetical protein